jgi:uncharacterized Zn-binding protein involved in type VI secretion
MSRPVARALGRDSVFSPDGTGYKCRFPMGTKTFQSSAPNVKIEGTPPVCAGDKVAPHPKSGCAPDSSGCSSYSKKVFANNKGVARIGDSYGSNKITSGSGKVFAG